jgi:hypothetical protein
MAHLAISYSHIVKSVYHIRLSLPTVSSEVRRTLTYTFSASATGKVKVKVLP